jgi:ABC-type uncharacterized transport system substrate-binding protein
VIERRDAEGELERLPALAAELVALKVDVIRAGGTPQALAAKQATGTIPIVFASSEDDGTGLAVVYVKAQESIGAWAKDPKHQRSVRGAKSGTRIT